MSDLGLGSIPRALVLNKGDLPHAETLRRHLERRRGAGAVSALDRPSLKALGGRLDPPAEAEGWEARDETELGRLFLGLFLQRSEDRGWITLSGDPLRCDSVADVASAWTADRLQAFWGPGQERASLVWRLRFEARGRCDVAATLAERLREGAERRGLDWRVERAEREVRLVAWRDG